LCFACSNALSQVMHLDAEKEMMSQCVALLGKFIAVREPNIRYLGLVSCRNTIVLSVKPTSPLRPPPPLSYLNLTEKGKFNCYFVTMI
jgi:hypothetical protein